MKYWYTATEKFKKSKDDAWNNYIKFSGLTHIEEIIGLDSSLSPTVINDVINTDYENMPDVELTHGIFTDYHYLKSRLNAGIECNCLKIVRNPESHEFENDNAAKFKGYELIDEETFTSAISNCGGFPESFSNNEVNKYGLIQEYNRAIEIQINLIKNNPDERHANTVLYAIFRYE